MKGLAEAKQRGKGVLYRRLVKGVAPSPQSALQSLVEWAKAIKKVWAQGPANTIELAKVVAVAKRRLAYGEWTQLWRLGTIPFSKRKADMLATIGKGLAGLDRQTSAHLPTGWNILYHLSLIDLPALKKFVRKGAIHPLLTLREAKELLAEYRGQNTNGKSSRRGHVKQRISRFRKFVHSTLRSWSEDEREFVQAELVELTQFLREQGKASGFRQAASTLQSLKPRSGNSRTLLRQLDILDMSSLRKRLTAKDRSTLQRTNLCK